jgi:selenocysteine-specific elongation factor
VLVEPGHRSARIRSIQTLGAAVDAIGPGNRVALNLVGVGHEEVERGDAVVTPGRWKVTDRVDARLDVLASLDHDVSRRGAHVAYVGSREVPVRVRVLGPESIAPGTSGAVRLHLAVPVPLVLGDRFVLRESGRDETIGGGEVLDVAPVVRASKAAPDGSLERLVAERGWVDVDELELLTGDRTDPVVGRWVVSPEAMGQARDELRERIDAAGGDGLDLAQLDDRARAVLDVVDGVEVTAGRIRRVGVVDPYADHPFVAEVAAGGFTPPDPTIERATLRELVRRGLVVERDGIVFHPHAIDAAAVVAARLLAASPGFTIAEFRDAIGATRKHALPLLNELDARGVTRRRDDVRIGGPRLPAL